jgi:hypothetical protein
MSLKEIEVGDEVAFFPGATVPFVIRSQPGNSKYLLVGDCYVHGLMNGEAFRHGNHGTQILTLV